MSDKYSCVGGVFKGRVNYDNIFFYFCWIFFTPFFLFDPGIKKFQEQHRIVWNIRCFNLPELSAVNFYFEYMDFVKILVAGDRIKMVSEYHPT